MGLVKTEDGWVYNTNGTLCVKIEDDAPWPGGKSFLIADAQDGYPDGVMYVLDDASVRSFATKGVVIAGWYKRLTTVSSSTELRLFSTTQGGGFNIEKFANYNMRIAINDGGSYKFAYFSSTATYIFNDLDWHFVVFIYDHITKQARAYIDGEYETGVSLSSGLYFSSSYSYKLGVGVEFETSYPYSRVRFNGKIAGFYVGYYIPEVWTNDYIRELYRARRPFAIPPKIPII